MWIPRTYQRILDEHLADHRQMSFLSGPRQSGKTSLARRLGKVYLNWQDMDDRRLFLRGPQAVAEAAGLRPQSERSTYGDEPKSPSS